MSATPVLLILGAGPGIGAHVAKAFLAKGYRVATASRSAKEGLQDQHLSIRLDLCQPHDVGKSFEKAERAFGVPPSVVVYNGKLYHADKLCRL